MRTDMVDLSEFNTAVEYHHLAADGVKYAFIRVWSGNDFDAARETHRNGCKAAGIKAFPYWVANPMLDPVAQGGVARQHCESDVWDRVNGRPFWAVDWELAGLTVAWAEKFGQPPVLYRSLSRENVWPDALQWIADWGVPTPPIVDHLIAWQWTDHLTGYAAGPLDASEAFIDTPQQHPQPGGGGDPAMKRTHFEMLHHQLHLANLHLHAIAEHLGVVVKEEEAEGAPTPAPALASPPATSEPPQTASQPDVTPSQGASSPPSDASAPTGASPSTAQPPSGATGGEASAPSDATPPAAAAPAENPPAPDPASDQAGDETEGSDPVAPDATDTGGEA